MRNPRFLSVIATFACLCAVGRSAAVEDTWQYATTDPGEGWQRPDAPPTVLDDGRVVYMRFHLYYMAFDGRREVLSANVRISSLDPRNSNVGGVRPNELSLPDSYSHLGAGQVRTLGDSLGEDFRNSRKVMVRGCSPSGFVVAQNPFLDLPHPTGRVAIN